MNKESKLNRRRFLELSAKAALSLPVISLTDIVQASAFPLNPEDSLKKLILVLGPWSAKEKEKAEDFAERFLNAKHAVEPYLPGSGELLQRLASRFPAKSALVAKINLKELPAKERELLLALTRQLYGFTEVRFAAAGAPPWGECQGDPLFHTHSPLPGKT